MNKLRSLHAIVGAPLVGALHKEGIHKGCPYIANFRWHEKIIRLFIFISMISCLYPIITAAQENTSSSYDQWVQQFSNKLDQEQKLEQEKERNTPVILQPVPVQQPVNTLSPPQISAPVQVQPNSPLPPPTQTSPPPSQILPPAVQPPVQQPGTPGQKIKNIWLPPNPWGNTTKNPYPAVPQDNPWNEQVPPPPPQQPLAPTPRPNLPNIFAPNPVQIVPVPVPSQPGSVLQPSGGPAPQTTPQAPTPTGPQAPPPPGPPPNRSQVTIPSESVLNIYK